MTNVLQTMQAIHSAIVYTAAVHSTTQHVRKPKYVLYWLVAISTAHWLLCSADTAAGWSNTEVNAPG